MRLKELIEALPEGFASLSFQARVEVITEFIGPPTKLYRTHYPSGGGSSYAKWEQDEPDEPICLETGGYDMHTDRGYPRLPYAGGRRFKP